MAGDNITIEYKLDIVLIHIRKHYKRGFLPLILLLGGRFAPIFMVTWFTPRGMPLPNLKGLD